MGLEITHVERGLGKEMEAAALQPARSRILCLGKCKLMTVAMMLVTCSGGSRTCICDRVWCGRR